jgi:hypothetical protein
VFFFPLPGFFPHLTLKARTSFLIGETLYIFSSTAGIGFSASGGTAGEKHRWQ